jgi:TPR repeat protein
MKSVRIVHNLNTFLASMAFLLCSSTMAAKMTNATEKILPRNQSLPMFAPHTPGYNCSPTVGPALDGQANAWFLAARALEDPEILDDDRDYKSIIRLTRQAAERRHWKAMLNLASFYLEGRDPPHGVEDAVKLVEEAMRLDVPDAFDRMGTYYMNGTGVKADATRAYAFWQEAARRGNPEALTFIGKKLIATKDDPKGSYWANATVGTKMLECAYSQGHGAAAYQLGLVYTIPFGHNPTRDELARALEVFHNGVKFGSAECAANLATEFDHPFEPMRMVAPNIDKARAARYNVLARALDFDPNRRFPNLDMILPLPPATLPKWDGKRDTLVNAARGVTPPPSPAKPTAFSDRKARFHLQLPFLLVQTGEMTSDTAAPFAGYWQPQMKDHSELARAAISALEPALYAHGERFDYIYYRRPDGGYETVSKLTWELWRTTLHEDPNALAPQAARGLTREIAPPNPVRSCHANERCPVTGTWQPWVHADHPLRIHVNQYWRQAWVVSGQKFPQLHKPMPDVPAADVTWHLMDSTGVDICTA